MHFVKAFFYCRIVNESNAYDSHEKFLLIESHNLLNFEVTIVLHWLFIGTHRAIYMVFWILYVASKTTLARLGNSAVVQASYQLLVSPFSNSIYSF